MRSAMLAALFLWLSMLVGGQGAALAEHKGRLALSSDLVTLNEGWTYVPRIVAPEDATVQMDGGMPMTLPHVWAKMPEGGPFGTYGVATYVRHISLDGPARKFAMRAGKMRSVYHLYAVVRDGDKTTVFDLGGNGSPGLASEGEAHGKLFVAALPFEASDFDLVVQVSNHIYKDAGFLWAPIIGPAHAVEHRHEVTVSAMYLYAGLLVAVGLVTMLLALWHAGGAYYYIGGGLLLVLALRLLLVDNYIWVVWPSLPLEIALRLEYLALFLLAPGYYWLVAKLYPEEASELMVIVLWSLYGMAALVILFAPIATMFQLRDPYVLIAIATLLSIVWVFLKARKKLRDGASWSLWGILIALTGAGLDIYLYIPVPRVGVEAIPFAALAFTIVLLGLFTIRYRKEREERDFLTRSIEIANRELHAHAERLDLAQTKAEAALDMKNSFLSNISGEIQTPLQAIVKLADELIDHPNGMEDRARCEETLKMIRSNGANLAKLMEDILSVADLETGRFEVSPEPTDPKAISDMALSFVEPVAHEKRILVDVKCEHADMLIDRRLMRQALIKIMSNALKFSPVNGVVTVRGSRAGGDFVFTIMDTGPGMEASDIPVAMSLFGKVHGDDGKDDGMGLGLPLVARFLDLLGGGMQIDSIPELGTTVTLSFPMRPREEGGLPTP